MLHRFMTTIVICNSAGELSRHNEMLHRQRKPQQPVQVTAVGQAYLSQGNSRQIVLALPNL